MVVDPDLLLVVLQSVSGPILAVDAARMCGCKLARETARRRVREAVSALRARGERVCADTVHGLWLESRAGEFSSYLARRRGGAKATLARARRMEAVSQPMELFR